VAGNTNPRILVTVSVSPLVPAEAVARGGGVVVASIRSGDKLVAERVVSHGKPLEVEVSAAEYAKLRISIDNHGTPDSDWIHVRVR
jgi:hypothetical protein